MPTNENTCTGFAQGCSSGGKASDRYAAEAGSIPRCGKGFFSQSQPAVQTLLRRPYSPRVQSHALTFAHVKDPEHWQPFLGSDTRNYRAHG